MELISDLAYPLPVMVIAEMLGVPPEDRDRFKKWSDDMSTLLGGDPGALPEDVLRQAIASREKLVDYFRTVAGRRRQQPGDDLLSALLQAE
jgi:cytochrome P450